MAAFQDDAREEEMRQLFKLTKEGGRGDTDAILTLNHEGKDVVVEFELKTTGHKSGSVTTVRDFGPDHIRKWKNKHWIFAFYSGKSVKYLYGSPALMKGWIDEKEEYITPDFKLAALASTKITMSDLVAICGHKTRYTLADAKRIHKRQYDRDTYLAKMDQDHGYSPQRMLEILQDRVRYVMERGSTLNNPKIPPRYFGGWGTAIDENHPTKLRALVSLALSGKI